MSAPAPTAAIAAARARRGPIVVLTGAGISAESGIPTFRGTEGYWRIGSRNYHPQELATFAAFTAIPAEVWGWYLYRRGICRAAEPNAAHRALATLEQAHADDFVLITQNVDGLHLRAGNSSERTWQIHGNLHWFRCTADCGAARQPVPDALPLAWERGRIPTGGEIDLLRCANCGAAGRPHVLWFDECYDENNYRADSALLLARQAALLLVVGTSGSTTLPLRIAQIAAERQVPTIVVDLEPGVFGELAGRSRFGAFLAGKASEQVPALVQRWLSAST
ncbi:MAG: RNA polymerase subunit sigma [Planctomycetes bacterium]|nr:RNA polymerase subunit sigma [Planctomycetota bacterium]